MGGGMDKRKNRDFVDVVSIVKMAVVPPKK
jgi:hypothetical protein